jgi:mannan endo-1,4-beta-mannosidase
MKLRLAIKPGAVTVVCAFLLFGATAAASPLPGFVTAQGARLYLDGQPYRPVGINIYNANSNGWCWYAMDGTVLDESLTALGGSINVFRAWFFQQLATTDGRRDWTAFDRTLAAAGAHRLKVIVTLIDQWGNCGTTNGQGYGYKWDSWYAGGYRQPDPSATVSYRDWVQEIVSRYQDDPTIFAWQLVNEPEVIDSSGLACDEPSAVNLLESFSSDVSQLIKSLDPNHLVSLGTIGGGQCGTAYTDYQRVMSIPTLDLCEYHDYDSSHLIPGDQWNGLQFRIDQCNALNKPLLVGELGVRPSDVGGTFQARADTVGSKLCAQFTAGVAGELLWAWNKDGSLLDNFDIGPNDPVLGKLGPWTNADHTCGTTAVRIHSFFARREGRMTQLRWRTASETGILGFNVYRDHLARRVRLNRTLIPAGEGDHIYSWRDRRPPRGIGTLTYRLQAVNRDGTRSWVSTTSVIR